MGIVGNLQTMQLEELLQWLSQSQKTGTLEIDSGKVGKKIFFKDGRILSSSSTKPEEYLGQFLVSQGLISEAELSKAIELQGKTGTLLGKILVTNGALREDDLHRMLRFKAEESIYDIFSWKEADFRFIEDVLPDTPMVPMSLDVTAIVMEGVQRIDEWKRIRQVIPTSEVIPVTLAELDLESSRPAQRRILELIDDQRTVEEICLQTHSAEYHVCRILFEQHRLGYIKLIKPRWSQPPPAEEASPAPGRAPGAPGAAPAPGQGAHGPIGTAPLLEAARAFMEQEVYEAALRHLRAARSLDPDDRGVQDAAVQGEKKIRDEIERAGIRLDSVPRLAATLESLSSAKLSPHEGFMLTRINGSYDIQSIIKITPMNQLDALLAFWKLARAGHLQVVAKAKAK